MTSLIIAKKYSKLAFLFSIVYEKVIVFNKIQKNGYFFSDSCDTVKKDQIYSYGKVLKGHFVNGAHELYVTLYKERDWYGGGKSLQFAVIFIIMLE